MLRAELFAGFLKNRNAETLFQSAKEAQEQYPALGAPLQFLAIASFEHGKPEDAIHYLERYRKITGDPEVDPTIERIRNGQTKPFLISLGHSAELLSVESDGEESKL